MKTIYPQRGRFLFDGGLNTKFERSIIAENESPACLNVDFSNGSVGTRSGWNKLNTQAIGSFVGDGLYVRHESNGNQTMVAFAGGSAWQLNVTTFSTIPSAQSVFTAGVRVGCAEYQQHLFIGNGNVIPYKYNGTDFTRHGVYPPTTTSTVASQAAGVLTGDYRYKVVNVNSQGVESDVGPVTATFTAAAATLRVTSIPVSPQSFGINARRLYRNSTAATQTYKLLTTINNNTTTQYDDNTPDASLGATAPEDKGVPPNYAFILYHRDRVFFNDPDNPNLMGYSDLNEPFTVAAENFVQFGDNTSNILRAIATDGENVAMFGDSSIEVVYMPSSDDAEWIPIKVKSPYGCRSPFGIVQYNNGLLFPAIQSNKFVGFAHLVGNVLNPSVTFLTIASTGSELVSDKIEPDMFTVLDGDIDELSAYIYNNKSYFALPYDNGATENNRIYLFDFSLDKVANKVKYAWAPWTGLYAAQFVEYSGSLYFIDGRSNGFVRKKTEGASSVYSDDGAAIDSFFWTKEFSGSKGDFNLTKDFRFANILVDSPGNYNMDLTTRVDSDISAGNTQQVNLNPGTESLWGTMDWGDDWGAGVAQMEVKVDLGNQTGKRIQYRFSNQNTAGQRFRVHGLNFLANVKGFR